MAKPLVNTWQEALKLAADCIVVGRPRLQGAGQLLMQLRDPTGQKFILSVKDHAQIALNGNLLALAPGLEVMAYAPDETDKLWGPEPPEDQA